MKNTVKVYCDDHSYYVVTFGDEDSVQSVERVSLEFSRAMIGYGNISPDIEQVIRTARFYRKEE